MVDLRSDSGSSLIELMVASAIFIVVSGMVMGVAGWVQGTEVTAERKSRDLTTLRVSMDRLEKELRQARFVFSDSTDSSVHFWLDKDRDAVQDSGEKITWSFQSAGSRATLTRMSDDAASGTPMAVNLVAQPAFVFNVPPPATTNVAVTIAAQTDLKRAASVVKTNVGLRNVGIS